MGTPWPAPEPDEQIADGRGPNFALRRAIVLLAVVAVLGAGVAWFVGRDGDDDGDSADGAEWNTVVLQNERTGELTLVDAEGTEIESLDTDLIGLLDVGLPGRLVVGVAGDPATDGLGVIDLDDGEVTDIAVQSDSVSRLDNSAYLLAAGGPRDPMELVDVAEGDVIDLLTFADGSDPIVNPSLLRIDPEHTHVAFTELGELETVLVDLADRTSTSLAGSLVDIASDVVLTVTPRGSTTLIDLYGFDGERVGTVETDAAAGGMLLDDRSALIVTRAGGLVRVDFDDESVDEVGDVADQLTGSGDTATSDSTQTTDESSSQSPQEVVNGAVSVLDRTRLVITGDGGMAIVDADGKVIASDRTSDDAFPILSAQSDRCILIGAFDAEQTLWDAAEGARVETFDQGFSSGRSADGCTITYAENSARSGSGDDTVVRTRLVGRDVDQTIDGQFGAVAPDGSAAVARDDDGAFVVDAASGDRVDLPIDTLFAVFTDR
jgi:hypothetical protein